MAIVKMHQASDGSLHPSFEAFATHEEKLKIEKAIEAAPLDLSAFFVNEDAGSNSKVLDESDIHRFVSANAGVLRDILNAAQVSKRGRKVAAA